MLGEIKVSHLLYMDGLKIYAKDANEMEICRDIVETFRSDIGMSFGLDKCAVIHTLKGKIVSSTIVEGIPTMSVKESYRYLGVLESSDILHSQVKESVTKEYTRRIRKTLNTKISSCNTITAISAFAMPVMRYGFGIL